MDQVDTVGLVRKLLHAILSQPVAEAIMSSMHAREDIAREVQDILTDVYEGGYEDGQHDRKCAECGESIE